MHSSGLVVEVHVNPGTLYTGAWYHVGRFNRGSGTITWGPSRRFREYYDMAIWPQVAITREGYVIITYSTKTSKSGSTLNYQVGTLDLDGTVNQEINFVVKDVQYDTGFHNSLSINNNGIIAEAHESDGNKGIFYRLGHLSAPEIGAFNIVWDIGQKGVQYDDGIDPRISINDNNDVVEVHGANSSETLLHYTRGRASSNSINFSNTHPRYDNKGRRQDIFLLNNLTILELHQQGNRPYWRTGMLDAKNPLLVDWSGTHQASTVIGYYPSITSNGSEAIMAFSNDQLLYYAASLIFKQ